MHAILFSFTLYVLCMHAQVNNSLSNIKDLPLDLANIILYVMTSTRKYMYFNLKRLFNASSLKVKTEISKQIEVIHLRGIKKIASPPPP